MFSNGRMIEELTTSSDRASCKETRKSSGAGVMLLGSHTLNEYTHKQHIIARSSVEAELYVAALGASETEGIVSLLKDLGFEMCLATDARATEHILHRQGIGRLKHIDVAYLWMQHEVRFKRFRVRRVRSEESAADLGTKPLRKSNSCETLPHSGCLNMTEESVQCLQDVAMSWDFVSMQIGANAKRKDPNVRN